MEPSYINKQLVKTKFIINASTSVVLFSYLLLVLLVCSSVDAENPHLWFEWTVSYGERSPLGVKKKVIQAYLHIHSEVYKLKLKHMM